jgi:hypothetical protein
MNLKPMSPKFLAIACVLILLWLFSLGSAFSQAPAPAASPNPSSLSPDRKWEHSDGDTAAQFKAIWNIPQSKFTSKKVANE